MLALTTALSLAIRPGVTDETLINYDTPLDLFKIFVEAVVVVMWIVKIGNEVFKLIVSMVTHNGAEISASNLM